MPLELTHIWVLVDDMPRALGFYRDTLGIDVLNDLGDFVELQANSQFQLSLFTRAAMQLGEPGIAIGPANGQHATLAFAVDALDEYCARLRAQGVEFVSDETNHPDWGLRTAFLRDPDGNLLCLYGGIPA
jgi:catechol 2,3-dioxygenase-like lactoylglutathione lyase family enzyme